MEKSLKKNEKLKSVFTITLVGIIIGPVFTLISFGLNYVSMIKGIIVGFLITFLISFFENFVFQNKFKKLKFSLTLIIRTIFYVTVISLSVIIVWVVHESYENKVGLFTTLQSSDFKHFMTEGDFKSIFIFAIIVSFLINLFTQINSLLGKNVLRNYLTGKYHSPTSEERAFMFLDLSSSTTIAEKLDPVTYHKFMNSYFFDIDDPIVDSKGEIYQYVGDEVVISWKDNEGYDYANSIECFFRIKERIESLAEKYMKEFGIVPGFKAGLHCGQVVTGEVGDSKREIVFHGDVLNTASRIQAQCNPLKKSFLVSEDILNKIKLGKKYRSESLGEFTLRGKTSGVQLYSIEKITH